MSEQMRIMRSKEQPKELRDRTVARHRFGQGYKRISAALKVPKSTVASIILKWKKFGTTRTGRPVKLSNHGRRALVREVKKNPKMWSGLYGRVDRRKTRIEFAKKHMKDSQTMRSKLHFIILKHISAENRKVLSTYRAPYRPCGYYYSLERTEEVTHQQPATEGSGLSQGFAWGTSCTPVPLAENFLEVL
ncbi:hypothetical protein NFI96_002823 [Prochilodus magdalenae]|nr:hypothetical protein NFI96_002823 [Prochilodus magdalenae]